MVPQLTRVLALLLTLVSVGWVLLSSLDVRLVFGVPAQLLPLFAGCVVLLCVGPGIFVRLLAAAVPIIHQAGQSWISSTVPIGNNPSEEGLARGLSYLFVVLPVTFLAALIAGLTALISASRRRRPTASTDSVLM